MLSGVLDPTGYTAGEERNAGDTGTLLGMQCSQTLWVNYNNSYEKDVPERRFDQFTRQGTEPLPVKTFPEGKGSLR